MSDDTAAPRFTEGDMLNEANMYAFWAKGSDSITDKDCYQKTANLLRQAAADLAALMTKEELAKTLYEAENKNIKNVWAWEDSGLDTEHPFTRARYYRLTDALIAAGVKVRT